jgi:hypothetical protein
LIGASFWELDWAQAVSYFDQVRAWGNLWDGTMTSSERYWFASMRYGDQLFEKNQFCDALAQYTNAQTIAELDKDANDHFPHAYSECYPATGTATEVPVITPAGTTPAATEPPTAATTEAPKPTDPPTSAPPTTAP